MAVEIDRLDALRARLDAEAAAANQVLEPPDDEVPRFDYRDEPRANGHSKPNGAQSGKPAEDSAESLSVHLQSALEIARAPEKAAWLMKPYLESAALVLIYGAEGTLKSFVALHWALSVAAAGHFVVYLHAEGRGLWKRLRAWCALHYPQQPWEEVLAALPWSAVQRPINLSSVTVVASLIAAIDASGRKPALIVVDTITRNSDGTVERSNEDCTIYLNLLDREIRARYRATLIFVHHVGHSNKDRARGPYTLTASTDANFRFERPDPQQLSVTVHSGRMKDTEAPAPFAMEAHVITIPDALEEDGSPVTSLAVRHADIAPAAYRAPPKGKNQQLLLGALREHVRASGSPIISTLDLQAIGKAQKLKRARLAEVRTSLERDGWIRESIGGFTLVEDSP